MNKILRPWGELEDARVKEMWAAGLSASQISRALGTRTRNSVIGRINRLGLSGRTRKNDHQSTAARIKARRRSQLRTPRPPKATPLPAEPVDLLPIAKVTLYQLNDLTCRYPIGDPQEADFTFCGRTCHGGPYCVGHAKLCYTPVNQRQARATERLANWMDRRSFKQAAA